MRAAILPTFTPLFPPQTARNRFYLPLAASYLLRSNLAAIGTFRHHAILPLIRFSKIVILAVLTGSFPKPYGDRSATRNRDCQLSRPPEL